MNKLIIPSKTERLFEKKSFLLTRGHDFVEIGGIKWATRNIGAEKPTDIGLYFQWGDTQGYTAEQVGSRGKGKKYFGWPDYKFRNGERINKYNTFDGKAVLDVEDDAVHAAWGGAWRMPTREEFDTLAHGNTVTTFWTNDYQDSGVAGLVCTDKTDSSKELFFPAAGFGFNGKTHNVNNYAYYWSKSLNYGYNSNGYDLAFFKDYCGAIITDNSRWIGFPIRGILDI